ncbi:cation/H(+) antiporter 24-like [Apium graveolens]|uniref:cation/H(+) antiporter 24-like n=1 Tax=Apium graveolens TaxID=4045 RepID=UPI003D7B146B
MLWIVRATPEGKPVEQTYIVLILLGVMVVGFVSDFLGLAIGNAPLWYGLAIPDGPPLGATLVEKSETIIMEILMPFSYVYIGLYTDIFALSGRWSSLKPLFLIVMTAYLTKVLATLVVARIYNTPLRESVALSLILSLRGQVELILFIHWTDLKMMTQPAHFTLMVLMTISATFIASPLINLIYDPTRPYMINKRRNIQHNPPNSELRIVVSIRDEESVPGFISLLEVSNPHVNSPFSVYALRLIELVGRASPLFIDHETRDGDSYVSDNYTSSNPIHNALKFSHESEGEYVEIHPFTSVSPKKSMYQDICELALTKKASLIILPFNKDLLEMVNNIEGVAAHKKVQSINLNVLNHAPCSVALLVDKGSLQGHLHNNSSFSMQHTKYYFAVLFLGGPDAREALSFADRMASHPDVSLLVIRFLSDNGQGDDLIEKKLDDGLVTWFWVKNEGNSKVAYREVVVQNGEDTLGAIQAMNDDSFTLWIVGRKKGINPVLLEGLQSWGEHQELGVIGEYVSSMDLGTTASVLVVQQQILRDQRRPSKIARGLKDCVRPGTRTN